MGCSFESRGMLSGILRVEVVAFSSLQGVRGVLLSDSETFFVSGSPSALASPGR